MFGFLFEIHCILKSNFFIVFFVFFFLNDPPPPEISPLPPPPSLPFWPTVPRHESLLVRPARLLSTRPCRLALALVSVWTLLLVLLLGAAPASALVSEVSGTKVGLQP